MIARRAALALLAATGLAAVPARAEPLTLEAVMQAMASTEGVAARFRETKHLAVLTAPLETRGELYFVPPDRMVRITTHPGRAWLAVDGGRVRMRDESSGEVLDLTGDPMAELFVQNFVVLFRGDLEALRDRYTLDFSAEGDAWRISLVPRRAPVDRFVASIELSGDRGGLRSMLLTERDGDRTRTDFEEVQVDRRFADEEIERLLSPAGAGKGR